MTVNYLVNKSCHCDNLENAFGAVSSLDILHDGTRLLVGHSKGLVNLSHSLTLTHSLSLSLSCVISQITHWDLENNKLLRFIDDAHPPGFAVLNIRVGRVCIVIVTSTFLSVHR